MITSLVYCDLVSILIYFVPIGLIYYNFTINLNTTLIVKYIYTLATTMKYGILY